MPRDLTEIWLPVTANPHTEAKGLLPLLKIMTAAEIISLITVSERDRQLLAKAVSESPAAKPKVEQMLAFRRRVLLEFDRLAAKNIENVQGECA